MRFFRNMAGILLTTAVNAPIGVLTSVLLARWLTPEDRGLYAVSLNFAVTLTMVVQLGWPSASIYRLRSVKSPPRLVATTGLVAVLGLSLVAIGGALVFGSGIEERFLSGAPSLVLYLVLVTVPFRLLGNLFGGIARGLDRFRYENWYSFSLGAGGLVALVVALVACGGGLVEALGAVAVVSVVTATGLAATVVRMTGLTARLEGQEAVASLRFGLKTYSSAMAARLHERQDVFVLAYLLGDPAQIAYFSIAKGAMRILTMLPAALNKAAYPQLAGLPEAEAARFACTMMRQGLLFVVPAGVVLGVFAPVLLPLVYGAEYARSVVPFLLLLPCLLFITLDGIIGPFFNAVNRQTPLVITRTFSAVVNLGLNVWWVPLYGVRGAAAAACTSFALQAVLGVTVFLLQTEARARDLLIVRRSDLDPYTASLGRLARRVRFKLAR